MSTSTAVGKYYLPDETPPFGEMVVLGFQHVVAMFPATVLVALLVGFDVGAVLVTSGIATSVLVALSWWFTGRPIPLYYGSSFSYIAATMAITGATFGNYAGPQAVSLAQAGIVATGFVNILAGIAIRIAGGEKAIEKILPPIVTGSVAMVIGIALSKAALDMASANWAIAFATLAITILASVYLRNRGFVGLIPVLIGAFCGLLLSLLAGQVDFSPVANAPFLAVPKFTLPDFSSPQVLSAIFGIAIMALATIPESTAHLFQIGLYVDQLAEEVGHPRRYRLSELIGINLVLDGLGDILSGMFGGVSTTNYGENNGLMAITRNYSGPVLIAAGVIAIALGFVGKLAALLSVIPLAVTGGLAIYLFGSIGFQGVALLINRKVDFTDPRNIAIFSVVTIVGIGGNIVFDGNLPWQIFPTIFPQGIPAIAAAAVLGIVLNIIFTVFPPNWAKQ